MTKNLLFEPFADGVQVNDVDFVQCRQILDCGTEFGESLREKRSGSGDGDVNVSVGIGRTFRPGTEPDDFNVNADHASSKFRYVSRDLSRASDKFLGNHRLSVSVPAMMSTGLSEALNKNRTDVWQESGKSVMVREGLCFVVVAGQFP